MAAGSLLTLLDDIASILDDVAILTKKAAAKTAGVLGDDLALNAQQVSGVVSQRELPVVWAVAKGSFSNKLILVPLALLIGTFAPWGILPLLMKFLSIAGTAAMFLVGGGIVTHGIPWLHHAIEGTAETLREAGGIGAFLAPLTPSLLNGLCGLIAGILVLLLFKAFQKFRGKPPVAQSH